MKYLLVLLFAAVLAGCASGPSPAIRQASQKYQKVDRFTMQREDVYRLLGEPQAKLADGREQWQVTDKKDSATIILKFKPDGHISSIEKRFPLFNEP